MSEALRQARLLLVEFGFIETPPNGVAYAHTDDTNFPVEVVSLTRVILGFQRAPSTPHFSRDRAFSVLRALQQKTPLPPVNVYFKATVGSDAHSYELFHGYHRYHLCMALGFTHIPVAINSWKAAGSP